MKSTLILTAALITMFVLGAHGYADSKDVPAIAKESVASEKKENQNRAGGVKSLPTNAPETVIPVTVKNIWINMPCFDKYGNEITARARYNMLQNELQYRMKNYNSGVNSLEPEAK